MKKYQLGLLAAFLFGLIVGLAPCNQAKAATTALYYNHTTGVELEYTGTPVQYCYNGGTVSFQDDSIGILGETGTALAPMTELFQKALNVSCEFCLSDNSIKLSCDDNTVVIKPGSKQVTVNGKTTTMSEAPVVLEDEDGVAKIYVPTKFLASNLGFEYEWDKALSTVFIQKTYEINYTTSVAKSPIEIPLYQNFKMSDIRIEDMYYNKQLAIYLPGDFCEQYSKTPIVNHYSEVKGIELGMNQDGETVIVFDTSKIMGYKVEIKNQTLYLTFDAPKNIYSKIVVIDPGHGGKDPGAIRDKIYESDINLSVAYEYTKELFAASDIKVYYTRVGDTYPSLDARAAFGSQVGADFFVSVHQNTNDNTSQMGTSVYYSSDNNRTQASGLSSKIMARLFRDNLTGRLGTNNLGIINHPLTVTTYNTVPAVLIELAFMSNPDEFLRLQSEQFRKDAGQAIFDTIVELFELYPTGR